MNIKYKFKSKGYTNTIEFHEKVDAIVNKVIKSKMDRTTSK